MDRPMLFSGPMVRAIFDGRKTQTRRVLNPQPWGPFTWPKQPWQPGDRLWVRETWAPVDHIVGTEREDPVCVGYRADHWAICHEADNVHALNTYAWNWDMVKWRPSIHMPRWASRLTLEVVSVRVERLREITEADALAEGIDTESDDFARAEGLVAAGASRPAAVFAFADLWDSLAKPGTRWEDNPWIWCVEFKREVV
jgi:hypothetical protein